ncbi:hypothetical protein [Rubrivirga sp.]|uniref:hypothetical protein n=1 Tax=Rubrivirga sp. TaxID=1885344 RepID=UPI003B51EFBE
MSVEEILTTIRELPERDQSRVFAELDRMRQLTEMRAGVADALASAERGDVAPWDPDAIKREGRERRTAGA